MGNSVSARIDSSEGECGTGPQSLVMEAERRVGAFYQAVLNLHGQEEAQRAAEDWLYELERAPQGEPLPWRSISLAAIDRLASRLMGGEQPETQEGRWQILQRETRRLLQCAQPCEAH